MVNAQRVVIIGGGPGGYEAALAAARLGAQVTVVDRDGLGGSAVLTDCVPSKTLIAVAEVVTRSHDSGPMGVENAAARVDLAVANARIKALAATQSSHIEKRLLAEGVDLVAGTGRLLSPGNVRVDLAGGGTDNLPADAVLVATGAHPRVLTGAEPDGERILTWTQLYDLTELPEHLIVVGSGVTGAEFASAYLALGSEVTLVSSRDRVLPSEDADAAAVIEDVLTRRGMKVLGQARAAGVRRIGDGVVVTLADGREIEGSHCLLAVGSIPNTEGMELREAGVRLQPGGYVNVDKVSRTSAPGVYAAGDVTGVLPLASVAAMQGRIAIWHALGEAVAPLDLRVVSATVFTDPEIATVGASQAAVEAGEIDAVTVKLPLETNARAKMLGVEDGFVKLMARRGTGTIVGGVVVAPRASELIHPVSLAVSLGMSVDQFAHAFTVYPSLSGSLAEAAHRLTRLV